MGKHRKPEKRTGNGSGNANNVPVNKKKSRAQLLFEPRPEWHSQELRKIPLPESISPVPLPLIEKVHAYAKQLLAEETAQYEASNQQASSAHKFYATIMDSGTWSDKVSALTLLVQESPIHNTKAFENLRGMASKKSRQQALVALGALKDMLSAGTMLPSDRKLRHFAKQPELLAGLQNVKPSWTQHDYLPGGIVKEHLVFWAFEDWLKQQYFQLLTIMEKWMNDEIDFSRLRAITFVYELLKDKPEQEENLLRLIVNKLGDINKKVASRASYLCLQLESAHPSMKSIVTSAIESEVLLRHGQSSHAVYYAVITLNQTILSASDPETANKLLDIYFGLFVRLLTTNKTSNKQEKERDASKKPFDEDSKKRKRSSKPSQDEPNPFSLELSDKIVAQVLTGVNRAFPYSKAAPEVYEKHLDTLFRITHSSNFNTSVQALQLIQQISTAHHITTDRFMRTLYESLLDPRLVASSKQTMYLNLLYRALKSDPSVARVQAFVKRLLQTLTLHEPPFITASLFLVLELTAIYPSIASMLYTSEIPEDDEDEHYSDVPSSPPASSAPSAATPSTNASGPRYDPRKRDPLHAHASHAPLWDILPYTQHYHPSVALFARALAHPASTPKKPTKPDPAAHTLIHFLDRFAYRNAKTTPPTGPAALRGASLMQPALIASHDALVHPGDRAAPGAPVNSEAFWGQKLADVPVADAFFHRYFAGSGAAKRQAKRAPPARPADDDDWDSEVGAEEGEIWKALVGGREVDDVGSEGDSEAEDEFAQMMADDASDDMEEEEEDGGVELNLDSDEDEDEDEAAALEPDGVADADDDEDGDPFDLGEDEADLLPDGEEDDEDDAVAEGPPRKKGRHEEAPGKRAKRKKQSLPMFASAEDYARMIEEGEGEGLDGGEY